MKRIKIEPRKGLWPKRKHKTVQSGKGWKIVRPIEGSYNEPSTRRRVHNRNDKEKSL